MNQPIEIDTLPGVVSASNDALAQALAELIATEPSVPCEEDLVEAVSLDLDSEAPTGSLWDFRFPAA